jgi:RimJ/RimL family protein N-acetyltransferase
VKILETNRLNIREITESDAEFILDLLNQPSFINNIGDRGIRTIEQAKEFIENRFRASYGKFGFGLYAVEFKETGAPIGICGFVKRDYLPDADIGFAFLPQYERRGYGFESASAMLDHGRETLGFEKVAAIVSPHNEASAKLLEKLGLHFEKMIKTDTEELKLFSMNLS